MAAKFIIYLFIYKFTVFGIVDIWTLKKKPFTAIKTTTNHKNLS